MDRRIGFRSMSLILAFCLLLPVFGVVTGSGSAFEPYLVKDDSAMIYPRHFHPAGKGMFFIADPDTSKPKFWWTDGTAAGTLALFTDPNVTVTRFYSRIVTIGTRAIFAGIDTSHGQELWTSDGTPAGTHLVMDINPGPTGTRMDYPFVAENRVFFLADHLDFGREMWVTDGTQVGTHLVKDIVPTGKEEDKLYVSQGALGEDAIFIMNERDVGWYTLWHTNGSIDGTTVLSSFRFAGMVTQANGLVYFIAQKNSGDWTMLYQTDGSSNGTMLATDGDPDLEPDHVQNVYNMYATEEKIFLIDKVHANGLFALWTYDIQNRALRKTKIFDGVVYPFTGPPICMASDHQIACTVTDWDPTGGEYSQGVSGDAYLWISDGTASGTQRVVGDFVNPQQLLWRGSKLVYIADTLLGDRQVWETDGTTLETQQLTNLSKTICLFDSDGETYPSGFQYAAGKYYLPLTDSENYPWVDCQLWAVDTLTYDLFLPLLRK